MRFDVKHVGNPQAPDEGIWLLVQAAATKLAKRYLEILFISSQATN